MVSDRVRVSTISIADTTDSASSSSITFSSCESISLKNIVSSPELQALVSSARKTRSVHSTGNFMFSHKSGQNNPIRIGHDGPFFSNILVAVVQRK